MTKHIKTGIIAAPERAAEITSRLIDHLPDKFNDMIDDDIEWEVEWLVNSLTGAAETAQEILYNAAAIKQQQGWDYAICLTDLPIFHRKKIVAADISFNYQVAQISIPSYGWPPMQKRIGRTITHLLEEMHEQTFSKQTDTPPSRTNARKEKTKSFKQRFPIMPILRENNPEVEDQPDSGKESNRKKTSENKREKKTDPGQSDQQKKKRNQEDNIDNEPSERSVDVRFLIQPRIFGQIRAMIGMTFANNPFKIMSSFKSVIAIAFTTGAFALIFPTIWRLSQIFSVTRLSTIMVFAILGLAFWIVIVHRLWESPSSKNKPPIRRLYNFATASTLIIDVTAYYIMLYLLFFTAVVIVIPPSYLDSTLPDNNHSNFINYTRIAWAEASIATIVSAMGAGLKDENKVRNLTYGFRQKQRYEEMKNHSNS